VVEQLYEKHQQIDNKLLQSKPVEVSKTHFINKNIEEARTHKKWPRVATEIKRRKARPVTMTCARTSYPRNPMRGTNLVSAFTEFSGSSLGNVSH